ncbi:hypothetical protein DVH05_017018 [Phytophthora capsici]|nr:hypothetical protein DVH05_017018 [Phytophthora capsici]|eukprot:jgi/Phyca11/531492/estExt2_fgenesh1_pg.C_PHYCAscaffold_10065
MSSAAAAKTRAYGDLNEAISLKDCYCLNEDPNKPFRNLFQGDETLVLQSDADEQLMLYVEFQDAVKVFSLNVVAPQGEQAPRVLKLFVNRPNLGFSDAGDVEPTQTIELKDEDLLPENDVELRFVKFQRVKSITIFVEENNGAEETVLSSLKFFGEALAGTNMNELKKVSEE